ncbi:MAG: hypothetical protein ACTHON_02805, partial [Humibacter sp.]
MTAGFGNGNDGSDDDLSSLFGGLDDHSDADDAAARPRRRGEQPPVAEPGDDAPADPADDAMTADTVAPPQSTPPAPPAPAVPPTTAVPPATPAAPVTPPPTVPFTPSAAEPTF